MMPGLLRRTSAPALAALLLTLALAVPAPAADPVAVVAAVKGKVEVTPARGGAPQRVTFGRPLERGDRLAVAAGASASVFFDDGNVIELAEKSTLTIGGRVGGKGKATGLPGEVYAQVSRYATGGSRETGLVAVSNLRSAPESTALLLSPRQSETLETRPAFAWRAVAGATRYRVTVSGDAGALWSRETAETRLDYPADAAALTPGADHLWEVQALSDAGPLRREETAFRVAAAEDAEAVRRTLERIGESAGGAAAPATHFLTGSYLCGRGLFADAAGHFETLARLSPDSPAPHEALGNLYRAVGLMDLAAAEFERALALAREN